MGSGFSVSANNKESGLNQVKPPALLLEDTLRSRLKTLECNKQNPKDKARSYREFIRELKTEYKSSGNKNISTLIGEAYYQAGSLYFRHGNLNHAIKIYNSAAKYGKTEATQTIKLINGLLISDTREQSHENSPKTSADPKNIIFSDITGAPTSNNAPVKKRTESKNNVNNKGKKLYG